MSGRKNAVVVKYDHKTGEGQNLAIFKDIPSITISIESSRRDLSTDIVVRSFTF